MMEEQEKNRTEPETAMQEETRQKAPDQDRDRQKSYRWYASVIGEILLIIPIILILLFFGQFIKGLKKEPESTPPAESSQSGMAGERIYAEGLYFD